MREVTDAFLLTIAQVSATLIGLFLVGVFFYVDTGLRRWDRRARDAFGPYLRASTRIVLLLFGLPLGLSLALTALEPVWARVLFAVLSAALVAANVQTVVRIRGLSGVTRSTMLLNEVLGSVAVAVLVVLPWVLGGLSPSREDLTWAILISLGTGFASVGTLTLSAFNMASAGRADTTAHEPESLAEDGARPQAEVPDTTTGPDR